jgi:hypothetical protein
MKIPDVWLTTLSSRMIFSENTESKDEHNFTGKAIVLLLSLGRSILMTQCVIEKDLMPHRQVREFIVLIL